MQLKLPEIQAKAYSDSKTDVKSLTLWGVELNPSKSDARASVVLMKFLRARFLSIKYLSVSKPLTEAL